MKRLWSLLKIYDLMIIALLVLSAYNLSTFGFSVIPSMLAVVLALVVFFAKLRSMDDIESYTDRLTINYMSLLLIKESPVTGIGFSMETAGDPRFVDHEKLRAQVPDAIKNEVVEYTSPHSMWIGLAIQTGVVGLFLFLAVWVMAIRMCVKSIRDAVSFESRLLGQLGLSLIVLFSLYGLFNVVFMHFLELLMCVSFAVVSADSIQNSNNAGLSPGNGCLRAS